MIGRFALPLGQGGLLPGRQKGHTVRGTLDGNAPVAVNRGPDGRWLAGRAADFRPLRRPQQWVIAAARPRNGIRVAHATPAHPSALSPYRRAGAWRRWLGTGFFGDF